MPAVRGRTKPPDVYSFSGDRSGDAGSYDTTADEDNRGGSESGILNEVTKDDPDLRYYRTFFGKKSFPKPISDFCNFSDCHHFLACIYTAGYLS